MNFNDAIRSNRIHKSLLGTMELQKYDEKCILQKCFRIVTSITLVKAEENSKD